MFTLNDDLSIYATRGDIVFFSVSAEDNGEPFTFKTGDVVRMKIYGKKDAKTVLLEKDFPVSADTESVEILLTGEDTKIGDVINKPKDYWYEIEVNPLTNPQTIIGYDEDGPKVFKLFPEGADLEQYIPTKEDIPFIDTELDLTSPRPVQNQATARAIVQLQGMCEQTKQQSDAASSAVQIACERLDKLLVPDNNSSFAQDLSYSYNLGESMKSKIDGSIISDGVSAKITVNFREANLFYGGSGTNVFIIPDKCRPIENGEIHTEDGLIYSINFDNNGGYYVLNISASNDVAVAPSGAGSVTISYRLSDYEIRDIRLGADGKDYPTAGEAVREQFLDIKNILSVFGDFEADTSEWSPVNVIEGYEWGEKDFTYDLYGNIVSTEYTKNFVPLTQLVPVVAGASYQAAGFVGQIRIYTSDKRQIDQIYNNAMAHQLSFVAPDNASYFGIYYRYDVINTPEMVSAIKLFRTSMTAEEIRACPITLKNGNIPGGAIKGRYVKKENMTDEVLRFINPVSGKTVVNFGDSIFGNARPPEDISTFISEFTGATVYNCGFGGCRMSYHPSKNYDAFSMTKIADSIASKNFSVQDAAVNNESGDAVPSYFSEALNQLKKIDFSKVDIITIAYGANDFNGIPLDNDKERLSTRTFAGALRYSIEKILNAYPQIRIFVCSPTYRFWIDGSGAFTEDSDTKLNSANYRTTDIFVKAKEVAAEYKLPFIDNYYSVGINKFNRMQYFPENDGAHHNENGRRLIAAHIAKEMF